MSNVVDEKVGPLGGHWVMKAEPSWIKDPEDTERNKPERGFSPDSTMLVP